MSVSTLFVWGIVTAVLRPTGVSTCCQTGIILLNWAIVEWRLSKASDNNKQTSRWISRALSIRLTWLLLLLFPELPTHLVVPFWPFYTDENWILILILKINLFIIIIYNYRITKKNWFYGMWWSKIKSICIIC